MQITDAGAENLFARLFTYAPRPAPNVVGKVFRHRNALEDFCTEALAWCLVSSKSFSRKFLSLKYFADLGFQPEEFQVSTQESFTDSVIDDEETNENQTESEAPERGAHRSRFDLVLRAARPVSVIAIIECKVAQDKSKNITQQIEQYRRQLALPELNRYSRSSILLLSPYAHKYNADAHISWDEVHCVFCEVADEKSDSHSATLQQFANFLKIRNLARMKLPSVNDSLTGLKSAAPLIAGFNAIFSGLRNDELVKTLFPKQRISPKMEVITEDNENYFWYGIWSHRSTPSVVVGFAAGLDREDPLSMAVQISLNGDWAMKLVPNDLREWFSESDSGREGDRTNFIFKTLIDARFDANPSAIEEWMIARIRDAYAWGSSLLTKS